MLCRVSLTAFFLFVFHLAWAQPDPVLVKQLREGGYVLYIRHTSTDFSQNDSRMTGYEDCANQRNLLDRGRDEARAIGKHIQRLGIPIGKVFASPFCRTMETTRLVFGKAQASHDVRGGPASAEGGRYDPLRKLLSTPVQRGENLVISSHGNPFQALAGSPYLAEGEIAVVRPEGADKFSVIARIRPTDW